MTSGSNRLRPARLRPAAAAAVVTALLLLVAAASRTRLFAEGEPPLSPAASRLLVDFGSYLFITVLLLCCAVMVWALWPREGYDGPEAPRRSLWQVLMQTAAMAVSLAAVIAFVQFRRNLFTQPGRPLQQAGVGAGTALPQTTGGEVPAGFDFAAAGLVLVTVALVALVLLRRYRRAHAAARERRALAAELQSLVDDTLDDLRLDGDPRRAVIHAYARTERLLAARGAARRPAEAPREYLARALAETGLSDAALSRLTALFEEARFSTHAIGTDLRAEAVDALASVRQELTVAV